ncbi:YebG family protein [Shewanella sp. OMA3-2]|uniref:YebG family protein n=1 Tax=Shewanella sp. OMA3-2 TaxID=2908650 RepID=UPI001F417D36|nr:YebG family protein [Shewanella sp. OMA3-2]UJF20937.1 YebG family protein [Shewanella sp. OMA3-2]
MAVITQFVVVREGVEKMTFTSKKEADAYDKMLDVVDNLVPFLAASDAKLDDSTCEQLAFYLANNKDELANLLRGVVKATSPAETKPKKKSVKQD